MYAVKLVVRSPEGSQRTTGVLGIFLALSKHCALLFDTAWLKSIKARPRPTFEKATFARRSVSVCCPHMRPRLQVPHRRQIFDHPKQAVQRFAFSVIGVDLRLYAALHNFRFCKRGVCKNRYPRKSDRAAHGLRHAEAVPLRHFNVKNDDMGHPRFWNRKGCPAAGGDPSTTSIGHHSGSQRVCHGVVVVDDQHCNRGHDGVEVARGPKAWHRSGVTRHGGTHGRKCRLVYATLMPVALSVSGNAAEFERTSH
ncbi:hypothetical protein AWB74_08182 [Caballeronia arvi]|uniref:Uncharacterized protein n=1 Tax=Caballeronia arvi TaxID=1777135 RepID=A0A158L2H3_9BURK|nr:hypothetical protein AWB74_08182 [Caballeronia arvi]